MSPLLNLKYRLCLCDIQEGADLEARRRATMIVTSGAFTFLLLAASLGNQIIQVGVSYRNFL
jgi:hypothetical protein